MNSRSAQHHRGFVTAWVTISLAALLTFIGLAVDTGHAYTVGTELQNAADSAALAAVSQLSTSFAAAQTAAKNTAALNNAAGVSVQLANSDVVEGNYNTTTGVFTANGTPYNAIKVSARRTSGSPGGAINLSFGPLVGVSTCNITRSAVAFTGGSSQVSAGIVVLDPSSDSALNLSGGTTLTCGSSGGAVVVNSNNSKALKMGGSATITATSVYIVGGDSLSGGASISGTVHTGATAVTDPLSSLVAPTKNTDLGAFSIANGNTQTLGTGNQSAVYYYSGGMSAAGGSTLTLNGGIYIIGPPGLSVTNGATFTATHCMFYFTGSGSSYGVANFAGGTVSTISAPTTGTYSGMAIFQDRSTPSSNIVTISYGATVTVTGTIYVPSAQMSYAGGTNTFGNQIIAYDVAITNGASLSVGYDGRNPVSTGGSTAVSLGN